MAQASAAGLFMEQAVVTREYFYTGPPLSVPNTGPGISVPAPATIIIPYTTGFIGSLDVVTLGVTALSVGV